MRELKSEKFYSARFKDFNFRVLKGFRMVAAENKTPEDWLKINNYYSDNKFERDIKFLAKKIISCPDVPKYVIDNVTFYPDKDIIIDVLNKSQIRKEDEINYLLNSVSEEAIVNAFKKSINKGLHLSPFTKAVINQMVISFPDKYDGYQFRYFCDFKELDNMIETGKISEKILSNIVNNEFVPVQTRIKAFDAGCDFYSLDLNRLPNEVANELFEIIVSSIESIPSSEKVNDETMDNISFLNDASQKLLAGNYIIRHDLQDELYKRCKDVIRKAGSLSDYNAVIANKIVENLYMYGSSCFILSLNHPLVSRNKLVPFESVEYMINTRLDDINATPVPIEKRKLFLEIADIYSNTFNSFNDERIKKINNNIFDILSKTPDYTVFNVLSSSIRTDNNILDFIIKTAVKNLHSNAKKVMSVCELNKISKELIKLGYITADDFATMSANIFSASFNPPYLSNEAINVLEEKLKSVEHCKGIFKTLITEIKEYKEDNAVFVENNELFKKGDKSLVIHEPEYIFDVKKFNLEYPSDDDKKEFLHTLSIPDILKLENSASYLYGKDKTEKYDRICDTADFLELTENVRYEKVNNKWFKRKEVVFSEIEEVELDKKPMTENPSTEHSAEKTSFLDDYLEEFGR